MQSAGDLSIVDKNIVRTELRVLQNETNNSCDRSKKEAMTKSINNILKHALGESSDNKAATDAADAKRQDAKKAAEVKAMADAKAAIDAKNDAAQAKATADAEKRAQIEKNVAEARAKQATEAAEAKAKLEAAANAKLEAARKKRAASPGIVFKSQKNINMLNKLGITVNSSEIYDAKQKLSEINEKYKDNTITNLRKKQSDGPRNLLDLDSTDFVLSDKTKISSFKLAKNGRDINISAIELKPEKLDNKEHIYQYGGQMKAKYLKYKAKYMKLKEQLNI
jgi:hypothetical protein